MIMKKKLYHRIRSLNIIYDPISQDGSQMNIIITKHTLLYNWHDIFYKSIHYCEYIENNYQNKQLPEINYHNTSSHLKSNKWFYITV